MKKKRSSVVRRLIVAGSAAGSIVELARGMAGAGEGKRWLMPLAVFLGVTGIVLTLAVTVEALAPFIYAIF